MDLSDFDNRFLSSFVLGDLDYDAQLRAIHKLLDLHRTAESETIREIEEIKTFTKTAKGWASQQAVDELVDHYHHSVFQDAAHCMAAVGMLAPFLESLFSRAFEGLREFCEARGIQAKPHHRWHMVKTKAWDCHYTAGGRKDIVTGIGELTQALELAMPPDLLKTLAALFAYRNKNFHQGFEWPVNERDAFETRIAREGWPQQWFDRAQSNHKPWIIYLSPAFVEHCLKTIDRILDAIGAFVREKSPN